MRNPRAVGLTRAMSGPPTRRSSPDLPFPGLDSGSGRAAGRLRRHRAFGSRAYAGSLEVTVEVSLALLVALFEEPAVAAFRIGQDLPAIVVAIPEEKAVGAVLEV